MPRREDERQSAAGCLQPRARAQTWSGMRPAAAEARPCRPTRRASRRRWSSASCCSLRFFYNWRRYGELLKGMENDLVADIRHSALYEISNEVETDLIDISSKLDELGFGAVGGLHFRLNRSAYLRARVQGSAEDAAGQQHPVLDLLRAVRAARTGAGLRLHGERRQAAARRARAAADDHRDASRRARWSGNRRRRATTRPCCAARRRWRSSSCSSSWRAPSQVICACQLGGRLRVRPPAPSGRAIRVDRRRGSLQSLLQ